MRMIARHTRWAISMLLISLLPCGVNAATNLLHNGDFQLRGENDVPRQWIFSGTPARIVLEPSAAPGGFPVLRIETDGRVINMMQVVAVPGGDGYVVRTAANVMRNSRNHIVLGGSSDAGAKKAAAVFCARIRARAPAPPADRYGPAHGNIL